MADISSDAALRAYLRSELGLTNASRVPDGDIDAEIQAAKDELSDAIAYKVESGGSYNFYGDHMEQSLKNYMKVRLSPVAGRGENPPVDSIPADYPQSVAEIRHTDFGNSEVNFWRDRMVHAFNRI